MPRVQPTPQSIDYEVAPQSNLLQYVDHAGYKTGLGAEVEVRGFGLFCPNADVNKAVAVVHFCKSSNGTLLVRMIEMLEDTAVGMISSCRAVLVTTCDVDLHIARLLRRLI